MQSVREIISSLPAPKSSGEVLESPSSGLENNCKICGGAGFLHPLGENGKPDYSRVIPCQCRLVKQEREQLQYCSLPEESDNMTFETFVVHPDLREAYEAALDVADGRLNWLTLMSPVDHGKTHLAVAICRSWLARGRAARYIYAPRLLLELREGYDAKETDRKYAFRLDLYFSVPLLVLDDLGTQKPTPWANEQLQMIIDHRYINALPLVVTTNKPLDNLPGDDEHRIASRLQRIKNGKVVVIDSVEYRLRAAQ